MRATVTARPIPPIRGRWLVAVLLAALLSGCPGPVRPGGAPEDAARQGRYEEAARGYERLAAATAGAERDGYHLDAARAWLEAGQIARALSTLDRVAPPLPETDPGIGLLLAYRALRDGAAVDTLTRLEAIDAGLPDRYRPLWYELRGRAYLSGGDASAGVGALVERELWLPDPANQQANRELLWRELNELATAGAPLTPGVEASALTRGWLALASVVQANRGDPYTAGAAIETWRVEHPGHPGDYIALRLLSSLPEVLDYPATVAVLLPLSGSLSGSAAAVRDGMMAAWLGDAGNLARPTIRFYDTAATPPATALQAALADGAEFVVGPLRKSAVESVAQADAGVTTLALNYLPEGEAPRANFFQLSLAPEHEASAAARRALDEGLLTAVALVPDNNWGERLLGAFRLALEDGGGVLLDHRVYETETRDFSAPITELLNLNESRERYRQVAAVTGLRMEFEPRRRQDVDFVFVGANPRQGRQVRPAFLYHYAEDLPIFATSSIFEDDPARNGRDLDGVVFADMPWIIAPDENVQAAQITYSRYWPARVKRGGRLYALGFDAYRLIPQLMTTAGPLTAPWPGTSGTLTMGPGGRIERALEVAEIRGGLAFRLPPIREVEPQPVVIDPLFPAADDDETL